MSEEQKQEPRCGNCTHFMMYRGWDWGECGLRLPRWMKVVSLSDNKDMRSDDTCSFHEPRDG